MKYVLIGFIYLYQQMPLHAHSCCRFTPTCSQYMSESLNKWGTIKGLIIGTKRLVRCHPLGKMGYNPVCKEN